jgi:aminoglycoside 6-adenylyltransferase
MQSGLERNDSIAQVVTGGASLNHGRVLADVIAWANAEQNVRALVLTGSAARGPQDLHELSDLDVELYVKVPSVLLEHSGWYEQFGEVLVVESLDNPGWHPTRLVYYTGGKIDFMIAPADALRVASYARPFRVLVDKDGTARDLSTSHVPDNIPTVSAFMECVDGFYAAAIMCAKCIVRNEPWLAKLRDWESKQSLLRMIEWDHKARYGLVYDTWYQGKHLQRWADNDVLMALDNCWSGFGPSQTAAALLASVDLFERLRARAAESFGIPCLSRVQAYNEVLAILTGIGPRPAFGEL